MYKNSIIKIEKNKGQYYLKVKNYLDNAYFIKTFAEPILSCKSELEKEEIKIDLIVSEIISLEDLIKEKKITIELLELLFNSLEQQLKFLEQTNHTVSNFSPKHIFFFKSKILNILTKFIFLNIDDVYKLSEDTLLIDKPFRIKKNMAPEFKKVKKIPNRTVTKTAAYWSLASLIENMLNKNVDIRSTRLDWALKRCLIKEPEHRFLLLI
jgi:hypothetical protein